MRLNPAPGHAPRGVVLLAAGSGQRMRPLTEHCPKALLPVGRRTVLDLMVDAITARSRGELVVVTGFAAGELNTHVAIHHGSRVRTAHNPRWAEDVNIASVATGVAALDHPERGYLIVETDLLLDTLAWNQLFTALDASDDSLWVTRGVYGPQRTGGVVHARENGLIDVVDYRPQHDPACDGWPKMLGMLAVGPREVAADRALRHAAMDQSIAQYYLMPWKHGLADLPARVLALEAGFAATFNTPDEFAATTQAFLALQGGAALAA